MSYATRPTRNLVSVMVVAMVIMLAAVLSVGCGGGSSSPTEPKPTPGVTPTPAPIQPSITFVSATPPCGSTVNSSDAPLITFRVHYVAPAGGNVYFGLASPLGEVHPAAGDSIVGITTASGDFINVPTFFTGDKISVVTTGVNLYLYPGRMAGGVPLATSFEPNCSFTILPQ